MLRMCSHLVNAAVFGSLAVLATKPAPVAEFMKHPLVIAALTRASMAQPPTPTPAPSQASPPRPIALPKLAQLPSSLQARPSGHSPTSVPVPKPAGPLPFVTGSSTPDAIVPPLARRKPGNGPAITETVAAKNRGASEKTARADAKPTKTAGASTSIGTDAAKGKKALAEAGKKTKLAADKKGIDLSGRSALGAAPRGLKCDAGLKYDTKTLKCAGISPKPTASPKAVPAPAPVAAKR